MAKIGNRRSVASAHLTAPRPEDPALEADAQALHKALTRLARVYQFRDREQVCLHGVSVTECYSLTTLVWHGPMTLKELADYLYLDKSTVSRVVDAMERKNLIQRRRHPQTRRAIQLSPSGKGRRLCATLEEEMAARQRPVLAGLAPKARATFIDLIDRLAAEVEERTVGAAVRQAGGPRARRLSE